ncbi:hypothetical protein GCM10023175_05360 [Pseudonocardia xishanensis]|uniref:Schlafen group 3-like DNA/RNA helicase domain-containing protein n=1 Tax=Pseudonocardia xishanensis TaxID=630995 RepID=A0ABP8RFK7_9PSEU
MRPDGLVTVPQYGRQPVLHPIDQVRSYCQYLVDYVPSLAHGDLHGIAYLHDPGASNWALDGPAPDAYGRLYTGEQRAALVQELKRLLDTDPSTAEACREAADDFPTARTEPTKPLLTLAAAEVTNREQFVLLDEQQVAYNVVEHAVAEADRNNTKTAVIVLGGPGSGKSVLALSLLGDPARKGRRVIHATGSASFTQTLRKIVVGSRSKRTQSLFLYFNSFIGEQPNSLDVLIGDEAHRIRETSVNRFTRASARAAAKRQVNELIDVAHLGGPAARLRPERDAGPGARGRRRRARVLGRAMRGLPGDPRAALLVPQDRKRPRCAAEIGASRGEEGARTDLERRGPPPRPRPGEVVRGRLRGEVPQGGREDHQRRR